MFFFHLCFPLVEGLATLEYEGDAVPALVVDLEHGGGEGGAGGARGHGLVVQVAEPRVGVLAVRVAHVLPQHALGQRQRRDRLQHLHFLVPAWIDIFVLETSC